MTIYSLDILLFLLGTSLLFHVCWSFNGPEPGGPDNKREKEADIPWFMQKANKVLSARTAERRHQAPSRVGEGTMRLLERALEAQARK